MWQALELLAKWVVVPALVAFVLVIVGAAIMYVCAVIEFALGWDQLRYVVAGLFMLVATVFNFGWLWSWSAEQQASAFHCVVYGLFALCLSSFVTWAAHDITYNFLMRLE